MLTPRLSPRVLVSSGGWRRLTYPTAGFPGASPHKSPGKTTYRFLPFLTPLAGKEGHIHVAVRGQGPRDAGSCFSLGITPPDQRLGADTAEERRKEGESCFGAAAASPMSSKDVPKPLVRFSLLCLNHLGAKEALWGRAKANG